MLRTKSRAPGSSLADGCPRFSLREVASASDRPELATAWTFEVEGPDATFDRFRPDLMDRLRTLDAKLAEALGSVVKGETSRP